MSKPNFRRALVDLDRELASVPFSGERGVSALVSSRRRIGWRLPALALAAAVAALLLVSARDRAPAQVAGFTIDAPPSSWQTHDNDVEVVAARLDLDVPGFGHVVAQRGARVARIDGGIRVVHGRVDVAVAHRSAGTAPALVRVSHGTIAVLGTRFTIEQSERGGRVVLHEGRIRFESGAHSVVLVAGSSLTWPLDPGAGSLASSSLSTASSAGSSIEVAAPPATSARADSAEAAEPERLDTSRTSTTSTSPQAAQPDAPVTPGAPTTGMPTPSASQPSTSPAQPSPPAIDVDRLLADLANLRARRRFADAAALLEQALAPGGLSLATVERLSYELGDIRSHQLADRDRACRHWQAHRARFPQGRYTAEIAAAVRRLGCEETTP